MLQRTREETLAVGSQALRTVLDRRVETRRNELLNLTRNTSVIVSNPSTSTPDPSAIEDPSNFFGSKNNSVIEKVSNSIPKIKVVPPPFEIYQDPVDSLPHHIPVIQTPSSVSVGQENIHPDLLDLNQEVMIIERGKSVPKKMYIITIAKPM